MTILPEIDKRLAVIESKVGSIEDAIGSNGIAGDIKLLLAHMNNIDGFKAGISRSATIAALITTLVVQLFAGYLQAGYFSPSSHPVKAAIKSQSK